MSNSLIYDMVQEGLPKKERGCGYCPYVDECVVVSGDTGWTSMDEWGSCPDEFDPDTLQRQLVDEGIATTDYPASEAAYISLFDFAEKTGSKLVLSPQQPMSPEMYTEYGDQR